MNRYLAPGIWGAAIWSRGGTARMPGFFTAENFVASLAIDRLLQYSTDTASWRPVERAAAGAMWETTDLRLPRPACDGLIALILNSGAPRTVSSCSDSSWAEAHYSRHVRDRPRTATALAPSVRRRRPRARRPRRHGYAPNNVYQHRDVRLMPKRRRAWHRGISCAGSARGRPRTTLP